MKGVSVSGAICKAAQNGRKQGYFWSVVPGAEVGAG